MPSDVESSQAKALRILLETQEVAALGTLHGGEPFVSMVPYTLLPGGRGFVIHVSRLAQHTKDMLASPPVSLMVVASPGPDVPPQALARATIQGEAHPCASGDPEHAEAKRVYLARFPQSEQMFAFADFSLFVIVPRTVRFIGGFAQARSLTAETLAEILSASP